MPKKITAEQYFQLSNNLFQLLEVNEKSLLIFEKASYRSKDIDVIRECKICGDQRSVSGQSKFMYTCQFCRRSFKAEENKVYNAGYNPFFDENKNENEELIAKDNLTKKPHLIPGFEAEGEEIEEKNKKSGKNVEGYFTGNEKLDDNGEVMKDENGKILKQKIKTTRQQADPEDDDDDKQDKIIDFSKFSSSNDINNVVLNGAKKVLHGDMNPFSDEQKKKFKKEFTVKRTRDNFVHPDDVKRDLRNHEKKNIEDESSEEEYEDESDDEPDDEPEDEPEYEPKDEPKDEPVQKTSKKPSNNLLISLISDLEKNMKQQAQLQIENEYILKKIKELI